MAQFLLLLQEAPTDFADYSAEEIQRIIGEYHAWRMKLEADGQLVGANKLTDEGGRWVSRQEGELRVVDGPFSEAKEVIGGYFLIEAESYDHAVEVSSGCPHLKYGKRIEVREVAQIHD